MAAEDRETLSPFLKWLFFILVALPGALFALAALISSPGMLSKLSPDGQLAPNTIDTINRLRLAAALAGFALLAVSLLFLASNPGQPRDAASSGKWKNALRLLLISFLVLFLELVYIRWIPSYLKAMSYFTNFVLIGVFLGMSIGCLTARRKANLVDFVPVSVFVTCALVAAIYTLYAFNLLSLSPGKISGQSQIFFGLEALRDGWHWQVPLYVVIPSVFILSVFPFIGLGQVMGRSLQHFAPVKAYCINILGSILGIVSFAIISLFHVSAPWWFALFFAAFVPFFPVKNLKLAVSSAALAAGAVAVVFALQSGLFDFQTIWSPYYRITLRGNTINVNEIGHQTMMSKREPRAFFYGVPYLLSKGADRKPIRKVLIIGAGSGNDVSFALEHGVESIDAVDIEPRIVEIGKRLHPDRPYDSPRVKVHIGDGRNFLKNTAEKYDMIVYALVDSLTLMSSYSSVRLETFLFTRECFQDIRDHLADGGIFVTYNFFRTGWLGVRIAGMLDEAFGKPPLVFNFVKPERMRADNSEVALLMYISGDTGAIAKTFRTDAADAIPLDSVMPPGRASIYLTRIERGGERDIPTDDWPFLYLRRKSIPLYNLLGIAGILTLSLGYFRLFTPAKMARLNWHFFFLGAAFMLLETRSITVLSLIYGSTWMVNSIVFTAILVMILGANLFVLRFPSRGQTVYYCGLFVALAANYLLPMNAFLGMGDAARILLPNLLLFSPILFAGLIFASSFQKSVDSDHDFGSNVAGVVLGGVCEYLSLVLGFNNLLLIGILIYLLSLAALKWRSSEEKLPA